ncbi:hypothetical protein [Deinococcus sp. QL22]|uniref:hypothetical protein n=1 Tax=Deinococcus sp. QL22 TaxID=2939437 RepID=UPI00201702B5|nr:hypothetical protein [Deinococcus sp. QL22]UQN04904.1 hypothetical protein M1R55_08200 [Deinococcus sp. QL22]
MIRPPNDDLPGELDPREEWASFSAARRHVGEAGFIQQDVLEHIINAGREHLVVTQALRRVVNATLEQLRVTPLAEIGSAAAVHVATLEGIVSSGRSQIQTAYDLQVIIQHTLIQVRATPLEHVSGHLLNTLSEAVHQQASNLEDIISAAVAQASSLIQIAELERVRAEAAERLRQAQHRQSERTLVHLERQAADTLEQIRQLEQQGYTHADQRHHLVNQAERAQAYLARLEHAEVQDRVELTRLEEQRDASSVQRRMLETAAGETQEALQALQSSAESPEPSEAGRLPSASDQAPSTEDG